MLSIGWVEMLAVAAVALIVVGPRDLPAMLRQIGKLAGTARRMSNEFRTELNKVTSMDEVTNIKKSLSQPLADVKKSLDTDFNKIGASGVEPTGALKTDGGDDQSVVDDIRAKAGLARDAMSKAAIAKRDAAALAEAQVEAVPAINEVASAGSTLPAPAKLKAKTRKPAARKASAAKSVAKPAATKPAAAKPATTKAATRKSPNKSSAAKPAAAKPAVAEAAAPKTIAKKAVKPRAKAPAKSLAGKA